MGFGWDVDDDVFDEDGEEDETHPNGEDEDLNADDGNSQDGFKDDDDFEAEANAEDDEKGKGKKKKGDADDVQDLDVKADNKNQKKKKDPWDKEVTKPLAKNYNMPEIIFPLPCPKCKKLTLFPGQIVPTGIRLAVVITAACFGAVDTKQALETVHYTCLNKACKSFWPKTGDYFVMTPTGMLQHKKFIFHIDR